MSVYVDELLQWGWRLYGRRTASCHMVADTEAELDEMADKLMLQRKHRQCSKLGNVHYDLTPSRRERALQLGAVYLGRREFADKLRELRGVPALGDPTP